MMLINSFSRMARLTSASALISVVLLFDGFVKTFRDPADLNHSAFVQNVQDVQIRDDFGRFERLELLERFEPRSHVPVMSLSSLPGSYGRVSRARSMRFNTSSGAWASLGK